MSSAGPIGPSFFPSDFDTLLGVPIIFQNDPARAMMYLGKGLELAEGLGDLDLKATMLCNMGNVLMQASSLFCRGSHRLLIIHSHQSWNRPKLLFIRS